MILDGAHFFLNVRACVRACVRVCVCVCVFSKRKFASRVNNRNPITFLTEYE